MSLIDRANAVTAVSIVPDRPSASYNAGEVVTGHCIITVNGSIGFDCIEIRLVGKARVQIPTSDSSNNDKNSGLDRFVKELGLLELVYKPATVYNSTLSTGKHDIGFSFILPHNIPSSLDSQMGFIRYKIKAKAGSEKGDLVIGVISPPIIPPNELHVPIIENRNKSVGLLNGKQVLLHCEIPRTGFTLGTKIPVRCTVNNESKKTIQLKGALRQEITFKAHEEQRTVTNKLSSIRGSTVQPQSQVTDDLVINVPINLPIVHNTCPIINIRYLVTAKLAIPASFDLRLNMPVVLTNLQINENNGVAASPQ